MNEQVVRKRNLTPFWILLAISGFPYLFSWIYFANIEHMPEVGTSNRGELIDPVRSVENMSLELMDGNRLDTNALKGNWTLITTGSSQCEETCMKNVYFIHQVRRLMGEERERIKRLFVLTDAVALQDFASKVEPFGDMDVVTGNEQSRTTLLEQMTINGLSPENRIFIMDPLANIMMVYNPDSNPEDIAKDFRRLLKVVRIGQPKTAG